MHLLPGVPAVVVLAWAACVLFRDQLFSPAQLWQGGEEWGNGSGPPVVGEACWNGSWHLHHLKWIIMAPILIALTVRILYYGASHSLYVFCIMAPRLIALTVRVLYYDAQPHRTHGTYFILWGQSHRSRIKLCVAFLHPFKAM